MTRTPTSGIRVDFQIIRDNHSPSVLEVSLEIFVKVGPRSVSHLNFISLPHNFDF